jgi:hypothetical protein
MVSYPAVAVTSAPTASILPSFTLIPPDGITTPGLTSILALMITIGAATALDAEAEGASKAETADKTAKLNGDSP